MLNYKHLTHCFDSIVLTCLISFDSSFDCFGRPLRNCIHFPATKIPKQVEMNAANVVLEGAIFSRQIQTIAV